MQDFDIEMVLLSVKLTFITNVCSLSFRSRYSDFLSNIYIVTSRCYSAWLGLPTGSLIRVLRVAVLIRRDDVHSGERSCSRGKNEKLYL